LIKRPECILFSPVRSLNQFAVASLFGMSIQSLLLDAMDIYCKD
jgi:hypothetical protein